MRTNDEKRTNYSTCAAKSIDSLCANVLIASLKRHRVALLKQQAQQSRLEAAVRALETASGCFVCGLCLAYSTWQPKGLTEHLHHGSCRPQAHSLTAPCPYCLVDVRLVDAALHQAGHFSILSREADSTAAPPLYQCEVTGCLVKSPSELEVQRHTARCHADLDDKGASDAAGFECALLKCTGCTFRTASLEDFVRHHSGDNCSLNRFGVHRCSDCETASTEPGLIDQHIARQHSQFEAFRIYEEVTVSQMGDSAGTSSSRAKVRPQQLSETLSEPQPQALADLLRVALRAPSCAGSDESPGPTSGALHFGQNASHFEAAENVDEEEEISLPFSESALRCLLGDFANGQPEQFNRLVLKMRAYSNYRLVRQVSRGRTVAYKCQCGRVFHTIRRSGSSVRPSTLADARRHVMGVHARVGHDQLTVCCQASRISREIGWRLYPDHMLMKLASDRPTKTVGRRGGVVQDGDESAPVLLPATSLSPLPPPPPPPPPIQPHEAATEEQKLSTLAQLSEGELERVIDLPYSWPALERLIHGACDKDTMSRMRVKMAYYSTYKVVVTRPQAAAAAGRRLFRCSGCSAASPHGMGDIRKHILGVHAKVPDRFKTACLHASRLSRDDNRLLPDSLLLQLARLKWKGSTSGSRAAATTAGRTSRNGKTELKDEFNDDPDERESKIVSSAAPPSKRQRVRLPMS